MSEDPSNGNPYESPSSEGASNAVQTAESADLTTGDWLLCIFCSGIACIIGIVRLIQGKPNAGKMVGMAVLFSIIWSVVRAMITAASQNQ